VALEQRLRELRDELAEVRVQAVDVLRPHALGQVALRPRKVEVDAPVERVLGRGHGLERVLRGSLDSWPQSLVDRRYILVAEAELERALELCQGRANRRKVEPPLLGLLRDEARVLMRVP
jgi:hypothetical protein